VNPIAESIEQIASNQNEWVLKEIDGLPLYLSPLLNQFSDLTHAFSTRNGGKTAKPMDNFNLGLHLFAEPWITDARENRAKLCAAFSLNSDRLIVPNQPHSNDILFTRETINRKADLEVDGITTDAHSLPLILFSADCVPILIFDPIKKVLSIVHAGWRGTASGIVSEALRVMNERCGSAPSDLVAAIGPAIGSCCYPVNSEVVVRLLASLGYSLPVETPVAQLLAKIKQLNLEQFFLGQDDQICPDLKAINALQLLQAGMTGIDVSNLCTACNPEIFYSYRQSGGNTGRQGLIAALTG
jgi:YfiH family protein